MTTCKDIITEYLKTNGYDGLFNDECACGLDDLMPCDGGYGDCVPGYEAPSDSSEYDYRIQARKPND